MRINAKTTIRMKGVSSPGEGRNFDIIQGRYPDSSAFGVLFHPYASVEEAERGLMACECGFVEEKGSVKLVYKSHLDQKLWFCELND
jgi:hypothetical protein